MELARNVPRDAHTGRGGAGVGSGSAGLSMRDLRGTIIRVGVSKGDVRNQIRERHDGSTWKPEEKSGEGYVGRAISTLYVRAGSDQGRRGFMVSGFCGGGGEEERA
jgi:hypothetical protein